MHLNKNDDRDYNRQHANQNSGVPIRHLVEESLHALRSMFRFMTPSSVQTLPCQGRYLRCYFPQGMFSSAVVATQLSLQTRVSAASGVSLTNSWPRRIKLESDADGFIVAMEGSRFWANDILRDLRRFRSRKPSAFSPVVSCCSQGMFVTNDVQQATHEIAATWQLCGFPWLPALGQCPQGVTDNASSSWGHDAK